MGSLRLFFICGACVALAGHVPASAQDAAADDDQVLENIVVTAQRREQSLQDVPVSVQVVSADDLDRRNLDDLTQLTLAAPTLQLGGDNTYAIRGIGTQIFTQTVDPSVAIALDDVNLANLQMSSQPFNDIERIEVLNGPQGLLFGKNASAGLLNVVTKRPEIGEFSGRIDAGYSSRNSSPEGGAGTEIKGVLNLPTGDNSALRLNAIYADQNPIVEDLLPSAGRNEAGLERWGIKAKYLHESGPWSVYLIGDYGENNGTGALFERTYGEVDVDSPDIPGLLAADGIVAGPENLQNNPDGEFFRDLETGGLQGTISYEFGNGFQLSNIAAWRFFDRDQNLDADYTSADAININSSKAEFSQFSNELRLVFPSDGKLAGQVGLYFLDSELEFDSSLQINAFIPSFVLVGFPFCVGATPQPGPPPNCPVSNTSFLGSDKDYTSEITSMAVFGQFDYAVSDQLTLTLGARVTNDDLSIRGLQNQDPYFVPLGPPGPFEESVDNDNFSFRVGGQYAVTGDVMVFASYSEGYKAPGFNDGIVGGGIPLAVDEETSETIEIGLRSTLLDNRLTVNITAFDTEFSDYQAQAFNAAVQSFIIQNAASVSSSGAELDVMARPSDNLTLRWIGAFLDSKFDEFQGAECYPRQQDPSCAVDGTFNAAGIATPLAADFTSTLQGIYEFDVNESMSGYVEANWYSRSDINFSQSGAPATELDSVSIIGLSAGLQLDNGVSISVFCRNCNDEIVPTNLGISPGDANDGLMTIEQSWGYNSTRTIGMNFSVDF